MAEFPTKRDLSMRTHTAVMILLSVAVSALCAMAYTKASDVSSSVTAKAGDEPADRRASPAELIEMASQALADGNKPAAIRYIDRYLSVADGEAVAATTAEFWQPSFKETR